MQRHTQRNRWAASWLKNQLVSKYALTRYLLLYIVRRILDNDALGKKLISNPTAFVRDPNKRAMLTKPLHRVVSDVVIDVS